MNTAPSLFDDYAERYDGACAAGLALSGESRDFFAQARVAHTARLLLSLGAGPAKAVVDFGCGVGDTTPYLHAAFPGADLLGLDVSPESIRRARQKYGTERTEFAVSTDCLPRGDKDLVYSNGVFHHIPPGERQVVVNYIRDLLRPGAWFALWENNPWNPGTRWIMRRIPFDRDAVTLSVRETRRMLSQNGFEVQAARFYFYFPRPLAWLRKLEQWAVRLPLGAQYVVLATKPI
jgi:trans-aconitate methyltransferase